MSLTFGSLFAGIGGFDLGFEQAGFVCKWQVEINEYSRLVLAKHWPLVRRHDDVRAWPQPDTERVDVICGGFPCQDISNTGRKEGIKIGNRSGLWHEFARIIGVLRPRYVVLENVSAILGRGMGTVLGDLASLGYDAEWDCLPACEFGACHERDRTFIVAYPEGCGRTGAQDSFLGVGREDDGEPGSHSPEQARRRLIASGRGWWSSEPDMARVVHGIPSRLLDKPIRASGNAVVPQIARFIAERIIQIDNKGA